MARRAVYPGTFDPVTLGHLDLIRRGLRLFDEVIVAVAAANAEKTPLFSPRERAELLCESTAGMKGVSVDVFEGLLVDYARQRGADAVIRGLRAFSDFEYEYKMALTNQRLDPRFEIVFFMPSHEYSFINSQLVREIAALGGSVDDFVPPAVAKRLHQRFPGGGSGKQEAP